MSARDGSMILDVPACLRRRCLPRRHRPPTGASNTFTTCVDKVPSRCRQPQRACRQPPQPLPQPRRACRQRPQPLPTTAASTSTTSPALADKHGEHVDNLPAVADKPASMSTTSPALADKPGEHVDNLPNRCRQARQACRQPPQPLPTTAASMSTRTRPLLTSPASLSTKPPAVAGMMYSVDGRYSAAKP